MFVKQVCKLINKKWQSSATNSQIFDCNGLSLMSTSAHLCLAILRAWSKIGLNTPTAYCQTDVDMQFSTGNFPWRFYALKWRNGLAKPQTSNKSEPSVIILLKVAIFFFVPHVGMKSCLRKQAERNDQIN